jgi:hypothetical protein
MTGDQKGLTKLSEMKKAEGDEKSKEEAHATQNTDAESDDVSATVSDAPVDDDTEKSVTGNGVATDRPGEENQKKARIGKEEASATITLDDITKIIVQKIKQNRSNNQKIGQLLKTYGAARVSELPESRYEAFITDLGAI